MSDKTRVLTVVLEEDFRVDDMEDSLIPALKMMKGVISVEANVNNIETHTAYMRARYDLESKLWGALKKENTGIK